MTEIYDDYFSISTGTLHVEEVDSNNMLMNVQRGWWHDLEGYIASDEFSKIMDLPYLTYEMCIEMVTDLSKAIMWMINYCRRDSTEME